MNLKPNQHLNIFRYFNESNLAEFIENNLSRAFAICLQQEELFFNEYIRAIIQSEDEYDYLFGHFEKENPYFVNLQVETGSFEISDIKKLYAIAMTTDENLDMSDFFNQVSTGDKTTNITDVFILIKDVAFIIEAKRNGVDCKLQLFNQVYPFIVEESKATVIPINFSWKHTVRMMERVFNIYQMRKLQSSFIEDFLSLSETRYPEWFPSKPFYQLPSLPKQSAKSLQVREKRLRQIIQQSKYQLLGYSDRMAISVDFKWASEVIPDFRTLNGIDYITFFIWPGNTKSQGYQIYNRPLNWIRKDHLKIGAINFDLETDYHMKFCHFNKFITSLNFKDEDLLLPVNISENFYKKSGKWEINRWEDFELFMDSHFRKDYNWKEKCLWDKYFPDTDRTYFTVSFGFETELFVPFKHFQSIDKSLNDFTVPSEFLNEIIEGYRHLLE